MRIFVLTTGRSGSTSFVRACTHATNFTAGHETRVRALGVERVDYPDNHIEADNRLSWFLGLLDERFGNDAGYVHLLRDPRATAESLAARWRVEAEPIRALPPRAAWNEARRRLQPQPAFVSIGPAFGHGVMMRPDIKTPEDRLATCQFLVDTVNANIRHFLKDKQRTMTVHLERVDSEFPQFWASFGLEGDLDAAQREWGTRHNARRSTA